MDPNNDAHRLIFYTGIKKPFAARQPAQAVVFIVKILMTAIMCLCVPQDIEPWTVPITRLIV